MDSHHHIVKRSSGILSGFVNWFMNAWNPYSEADLLKLVQRKIQNKEYGIQIPWKAAGYPDICDEMALMLKCIKQESVIPRNDFLQCSNSESYNSSGKEVELSLSDLSKILNCNNTESVWLILKESECKSDLKTTNKTLHNKTNVVEIENLKRKSETANFAGDDDVTHITFKSQISSGRDNNLILNRNTSAKEDCKEVTETVPVKNGDYSIVSDGKKAPNFSEEQKDETINKEEENGGHIGKEVSQKDSQHEMNTYNDSVTHQTGNSKRNEINLGAKKSLSDIEVNIKHNSTAEKETDCLKKEKSFFLKLLNEKDDVDLTDCDESSYDDVHVKIKRKSVTWEDSDGRDKLQLSDSDSVDTGHNVPSSSYINPEKECKYSSSEEEIKEQDLAYGREGFEQYKLFVEIEKRVQIGEINDERNRLRQLYRWRIHKIKDMMRIAKAYYHDPTGKAVDEWKELKKGMKLQRQEKSNTDARIKLAKLPEFLPFFTVIITLAQLVTCAVLCGLGGFATVGLEPSVKHRDGIQTFLGLETVHKWNIPNVWIGPTDTYMIGVGAFFAPCLRDDIVLRLKSLEQNYSTTEPLGCCEMESRNTAATTTQAECQDITDGVGFWRENIKCSDRIAGQNSVSHNLKPCCYNIIGQCKLTTHKHCVFLGGHYSKNAEEHCSQINCLSSVCSMGGLSPMADKPWLPENPAQWWRLPLSIIYHHGIIHVVLIAVVQIVVMRIMEKSIGWLRIMIVYFLSGIGGILVATVFEPYTPHVGATGSVFGLLGVTIVEILLLWKLIKRSCFEILKIFVVLIFFLLSGTLPYISNYSIIAGLIIGLCSGVIVLPYVTFSKMSKRSRFIIILVCVPVLLIFFFVLLYFFFKVQTISECSICKLINCIPYTDNMCREDYYE